MQTVVTVAVVGVLASIALPTYASYVHKTAGFRDGDRAGGTVIDAVAGVGDGMTLGLTAGARAGINWAFDRGKLG